ncbi:MAG: T9SS type A sorting domain-containing protein [Bacteroidetes bacterium]|nr:T9SS type A sorting domain-containing protein [Bacteroidota bacterium]
MNSKILTFLIFIIINQIFTNKSQAQEGINLVSDFFPGSNSGQPIQFVKVNNHLLFSVLDSDTLAAYYSINADKSITKLFNYLPPNGHGTGISVLNYKQQNLEGKLLFLLEDYRNPKTQLWITDGTKNGTFFLKDVSQFSQFGITNFFMLNSKLYFLIDGEETALWETDGTTPGTKRVFSFCTYNGGIDPCYSQYSFNAYNMPNNKAIFFVGTPGEDMEPWISDGTPLGTLPITILPGILPFNKGMALQGGEVLNGKLIFGADINNAVGYEPYLCDGTVTGTTLLKNINQTTGNGYHNKHSRPSEFFQFNGKVFFNGNDGIKGEEIWVTDGTSAGTTILIETQPGKTERGDIKRYYPFNSKVIFQANSKAFNLPSKNSIYITDGTPAGSSLLKTMDYEFDCFIPKIEYNNLLYFTARSFTKGSELWKTNGTIEGTQKIKTINPVSENEISLDISPFPLIANQFYFMAKDGTKNQLWKSQGTTESTNIVALSNLLSNPSFDYKIESMIEFNGDLYFNAEFNEKGFELWRYSPTVSGIKNNNLAKINVFPNPSNGQFYIETGDKEFNTISIYNMLGNEIYQTAIFENNIQLKLDLPIGNYILKCNNEKEFSEAKLIFISSK